MSLSHRIVRYEFEFVAGEIVQVGGGYFFLCEGFRPQTQFEHVSVKSTSEHERCAYIIRRTCRQLSGIRVSHIHRTGEEAYLVCLVVISDAHAGEVEHRIERLGVDLQRTKADH